MAPQYRGQFLSPEIRVTRQQQTVDEENRDRMNPPLPLPSTASPPSPSPIRLERVAPKRVREGRSFCGFVSQGSRFAATAGLQAAIPSGLAGEVITKIVFWGGAKRRILE